MAMKRNWHKISTFILIAAVLIGTATAVVVNIDGSAFIKKIEAATKGKMLVGNGSEPAGLGVGADKTYLMADSSYGQGVTWIYPSLWNITNYSSVNLTMTTANQFYDIINASNLPAGGYLIRTMGQFAALTPTGAYVNVTCKLWDGITVFESAEQSQNFTRNGNSMTISLAGIVRPAATTTYRMSCASGTASVVALGQPNDNGGSTTANRSRNIDVVKIG